MVFDFTRDDLFKPVKLAIDDIRVTEGPCKSESDAMLIMAIILGD